MHSPTVRHPTPVARRRLALRGRSAPVAPLVASAVVLLGAVVRRPSLRAVGDEAAAGAWYLEGGAGYLALAPVHALLDQMTLLTPAQHVALLLSVVVGGVVAATRLGCAASPCLSRVEAGAAGGTLALVLLLALCTWGALAPRPMVRLAGGGPDELVVDFHAHSGASHDARPAWTTDQLRGWLEGAGFHAAYVTDHATLWPADWESRASDSPRRNAVRLLPGIEVRGLGEHLNILGVTALDSALFVNRATRLDEAAFREAARAREVPPVALLTSPLKRQRSLDQGVLHAVEVSDAAPKGLDYGWRHRAWLHGLADSLQLHRLAGSDLHGWGRTAAAWTVLRLPGWRELTPHALDLGIRRALHRADVVPLVLERPPLAGTGTAWGVALTAPLLAHAVLTRLSWRERVAWIAWAWLSWLLVLAWRKLAPGAEATLRRQDVAVRRGVRVARVTWRRRTRVAWAWARAVVP